MFKCLYIHLKMPVDEVHVRDILPCALVWTFQLRSRISIFLFPFVQSREGRLAGRYFCSMFFFGAWSINLVAPKLGGSRPETQRSILARWAWSWWAMAEVNWPGCWSGCGAELGLVLLVLFSLVDWSSLAKLQVQIQELVQLKLSACYSQETLSPSIACLFHTFNGSNGLVARSDCLVQCLWAVFSRSSCALREESSVIKAHKGPIND